MFKTSSNGAGRTGALRVFALALAASTAVVAAPAAAQNAVEFDLTMGVITSPGDVYTAMTQGIPERIDAATDGRVQITVSDSLVAPDQIASAVRDGRLPMSAALHTYLAAEEPRMGIFNLPGLIDNIDEFHGAGESFWFDDVAAIWAEKWNARVLAQGAWCPTRLFSKEPIHTIEDFQGKRLRVHNPQTAAMMNVLGALPTPMAMTEIMPGLERGVIDGLFTSMCVGAAFEFPRVAPHVQDWKIGPITGWAILISEQQWDELPEDLRETIETAMNELQEEAYSTYGDYIATAEDRLGSLGAQIWEAPSELAAQLNQPEYADAAYDSWHQRAGEVGFDGPEYVQRVREALGKSE